MQRKGGEKLKTPKILVLRFSSIGDIVVTTPVIRCLKLQLGAEIHFAVKQRFATVIQDNIYIDRLQILEDSLEDLMEKLKNENYDLVIDLHRNIRSAKIRRSLGKKSITFSKLSIQKLLWVYLKWNRLPSIHLVDRYMEAIAHLGVANDGQGLDYFIPESARDEVDQILPHLPRDHYVLVLGAAHLTKRIPESKAKEIIEGCSIPCVLVGGPEEEDIARRLKDHLPERVINSVGKTTIPQSAEIIRRTQMVITGDTGMMHIAAALKKKIILVWGSTERSFGMYPYYGDHDIFQYDSKVALNCNPCTKMGNSRCPKGHFRCMMEQNTTQICTILEEHIPTAAM